MLSDLFSDLFGEKWTMDETKPQCLELCHLLQTKEEKEVPIKVVYRYSCGWSIRGHQIRIAQDPYKDLQGDTYSYIPYPDNKEYITR